MFTIDEVAKELEVSTATVRNWYKSGRLTAERNGRTLLFHSEPVKLQKASSASSRRTKRANRVNNLSRSPSDFLKSPERMNLFELLVDLVDKTEDLSSVMCGVAASIHTRPTANQATRDLLEFWKSESDETVYSRSQAIVGQVNFEAEYDVAGEIYQSLLTVSQRSKSGIYLTPLELVNKIVDERPEVDGTIVDPACGTGRFLVAVLRRSPKATILGIDNDAICTRLAELNLAECNTDHRPKVVLGDGLAWLANHERIGWIVGNPPWGSRVIERPSTPCPIPLVRPVDSWNAASLFTIASTKAVKRGGRVTFLLPEALFAVKQHRRFREQLLDSVTLESLEFLGSRFQGVQSDTMCVDLLSEQPRSRDLHVVDRNGIRETRDVTRLRASADLLFLEHDSDARDALLARVFEVPHDTLKGNAEWALGIVTGNNKRFVSQNRAPRMEPVFRGRDILTMGFKEPEQYIIFEPNKFQQVAPEWKYRSEEKIIYRFISNRIVCAYDDRQRLTLNSANVMIPMLDLPTRVVALLLNCALYQFIFRVRCKSTKVLRSHLELLPIPKFALGVAETLNRAVTERDVKGAVKLADEALATYFGLTGTDLKLLMET